MLPADFQGAPGSFRTATIQLRMGWTGFIAAGLIVVGTVLAEEQKAEMGTLKGDRVNIRARPLPTAEICGQLHKGDSVEIIERRSIQITGANAEEWVRIVLPESVNVWIQSGLIGENGLITKKVNGRAGPGLTWPVLCLFSKGNTVQARTNTLDWVGVAPPRTASAWIAGRFIASETDPIPTATIAKPE